VSIQIEIRAEPIIKEWTNTFILNLFNNVKTKIMKRFFIGSDVGKKEVHFTIYLEGKTINYKGNGTHWDLHQ